MRVTDAEAKAWAIAVAVHMRRITHWEAMTLKRKPLPFVLVFLSFRRVAYEDS